MSASRVRVMVIGAEAHQGLAVIRGLGAAGADVIAAGAERRSLAFYSRYVMERVRHRSPLGDVDGFVRDICDAARRVAPDLILPATDATLAALLARRREVEQVAPLAAPPNATAAYALDKRAMLDLATSVGVPVPRSAVGATMEALLTHARLLRPPYVVKRRGHERSIAMSGDGGLAVRYAADRNELRRVLLPLAGEAEHLLVQEYVPGIGRCVASVWRQGRPVALFAYERERELPLSGGVSVVRRSIALDPELSALTTKLLATIGWHGVATVEFRYDRRTRRYNLMEINGRFPGATALCIDAGMNLPQLAMSVHLDRETPVAGTYRCNVRERWLYGDLAALLGTLKTIHGVPVGIIGRIVAFASALMPFVRDFGRVANYDEFRLADPKPGAMEAWGMVSDAARAMAMAIARLIRPSRKSAPRPEAAVPTPLPAARDIVSAAPEPATRMAASAVAQRSIRA
ncbi:MAG TPA: ATP-grasp domain-containing protein [Gemmatimonadaceae bacterium]